MRIALFLTAGAVLCAQTRSGGDRLKPILSRVSEEAEVFAQSARDLVAQETLEQRALKAPPRFRPRLGASATLPPKPQYVTREIVSEYGFTVFRESPGALHELRQVVSVDGRPVLAEGEARRTLMEGVRSEDDHVKKRMLEQFRKHGLDVAAADFGQLILLFTKRGLANYAFRQGGSGRIGADPALSISFQQTGGTGSLMIFEKRKAVRQPLEGELWVREPDFLPLRIVLRSAREEHKVVLREVATVDYVVGPQGVIVPSAVLHREYAGETLTVENIFRYSRFRKFGADAEIKFQ